MKRATLFVCIVLAIGITLYYSKASFFDELGGFVAKNIPLADDKRYTQVGADSSKMPSREEFRGDPGGKLKCKDCNLIMISLSNTSAKHMSLYGYERVTTPSLDKWSRNAVLFKNAFTQSSWTLPVGVSLFTSLYPYTHKVLDRYASNVLDKSVKTFPKILKDAGYETAAFTGGLDYSKKFNYMEGFDIIEESGTDFLTSYPSDSFKNNLGDNLDKGLAWVKANSGKKFFLFVHGYDTHCPFNPPSEFKGTFSDVKGKNIKIDNKLCVRGYKNREDGKYKGFYYRDKREGGNGMGELANDFEEISLSQDDITYMEDLYDEEILAVDWALDDFLGKLDEGILEKTIILIYSDHGEMFAKHGRFGRAGTVRGTFYDDVLKIPLIIKIPGQKGKTADELVQIVDVMPTILSILDISTPVKIQGKNLIPAILEGRDINKYVFAGSTFGSNLVNFVYKTQSVNETIRDVKWKLIREIKFADFTPDNKGHIGIEEEAYELYDLENDPDETTNLANKEVEIMNNLKYELSRFSDDTKKFSPLESSAQALPEDFIEEAKKRGYW